MNGSFSASDKKKLILVLVKQRQIFCLSLHYNSDNSYLFVNRKETYKFNASNKNANWCISEAYLKHVDS